MFVVEGMDKVREAIEKNRERKLTKHKKLPNTVSIRPDAFTGMTRQKTKTKTRS